MPARALGQSAPEAFTAAAPGQTVAEMTTAAPAPTHEIPNALRLGVNIHPPRTVFFTTAPCRPDASILSGHPDRDRLPRGYRPPDAAGGCVAERGWIVR